MKNVIVIGSLGIAIAGLFALAMGNPLLFLACMFPIFIVSQS
jgi:hypothetical protein